MPKTILLHGHKSRSRVIPGVWRHCLTKARGAKRWAAEANTRTWRSQAGGMSLETLERTLASDVETLAKEAYRYLHLRARAGGSMVVIDREARRLWVELGGTLRSAKTD